MTFLRAEHWRPQGIDDIEPNAWEALRETDRSVCLTAGAGAGKTEFLAQKAAYLLQTGKCPAPKRILAISFKRDAARNLGLRVQERCAAEQSRRFDSMTFDSFTKQLVDRFRAAISAPYAPPPNYRIVLPRDGDYSLFLQQMESGLSVRPLERLITRTALPVADADLPEHRKELLSAYWQYQYENFDEVLLSFLMINRLAEYMIRLNPEVKKALQLTYPYVFLDEFQDTTVAQFQLLQTAFSGSDAFFTAVGDDKQRIMGWADAMPNAFEVFTEEFDARTVSLVLNWRSHEALVAIQRVIAATIDPNSVPVEARGIQTVAGDVAAIWDFDSREEECRTLAAWLRAQVDSGMVEPHDAAILVRMRADQVEDELAPALAAEGLALRNLARIVGAIAIQDLLCEELTTIVVPLLRLGATKKDADAWSSAQAGLRYVHSLADSDEIGQQKLQQALEKFSRELRTYMKDNSPEADSVREVIRRAIDFVGVETLRQAFPGYGRDADFERVREGCELLLIECAEVEATWCDILDRFEGRGQVPLMTVHKSKGLEFHTMVFFGLDNGTWWSLEPNRPEELNSFFVAFTRAEQRAFFTSCSERGNPIGWIDSLLAPAGVARITGRAIIA